MTSTLMTQDDAAAAILAYAFSGAIGPVDGKGVNYALLNTISTAFTWSISLEDFDADPMPIDRYLVKIDRRTKEISPPKPITLSEAELKEVILAATKRHTSSSSRFTDGSLSTSYRVNVQNHPEEYVVQLRHHGKVASMDFLMALISRTIDPGILPVPTVYPIPGEMERQEMTGMGKQVTQLIPGEMADSVYYSQLSHEQRLAFVKRAALAFQACWEQIRLPHPPLIGELLGDESNGLVIGPDRHYSLGGPFTTVRAYLRAWIRYSLSTLIKQQGIDEFKNRYLARIENFIDRYEYDIPAVVEDIPIVAIHEDMGLHNIILGSSTEIRAIIDWEFIASAPYAAQDQIIETLFRKPAPNQFGPELDRANELRAAFWDTIPEWKRRNESEATKTFLDWFKFGLFMKPEPLLDDLTEEEKQAYWQENIRIVEEMLDRYGATRS
ncbi:uncharacterized protein KY384_004661 [Bacidia gigantensis]|uniref:uncharacterized protein n=1 Tax=Bacidia gigantensis TaxID=2732470 RepID=UPI001D03F38A|nr:uncharacterized protein KY384_004661 [Bacidia gigantensis]KAG8530623.1 hypothetical protein KY384_004661 [Bacidia gigantensis]